jgi:hypothetical protein
MFVRSPVRDGERTEHPEQCSPCSQMFACSVPALAWLLLCGVVGLSLCRVDAGQLPGRIDAGLGGVRGCLSGPSLASLHVTGRLSANTQPRRPRLSCQSLRIMGIPMMMGTVPL